MDHRQLPSYLHSAAIFSRLLTLSNETELEFRFGRAYRIVIKMRKLAHPTCFERVTFAFGGQSLLRTIPPFRACEILLAIARPGNSQPSTFHLEMGAKQLILLDGVLTAFSKYALKSLNNQTDFDSAIRRFDPSRPSQALTRPRIVVNFCGEKPAFGGVFARLRLVSRLQESATLARIS